jgi:predicted nucleic acid-binding protein
MIYVFLDTNILIRFLSQGKPGCEPELFDNLRTLVTGNAFRLLVPDVVRFELEKQMETFPRALKTEFGKLKKSVNETNVWSEIVDAKESILQELVSLCEAKKLGWYDRFKSIDEFLRSDHVTRLPYTPEIMCRARIRLMHGGKPEKDQDAAIIESLSAFFETCTDDQSSLLFCSENHIDFAVELGARSDLNRRFAINPEIAKVLPKTHYFLSLDELLEIDSGGYDSIPSPPEKEILQAIDRMSEFEDVEFHNIDECWAAIDEADAFYEHQISKDFITNTYPNLPVEFQKKRDECCDCIENMLLKCRSCQSWDDRSEYKLSQWIEYVPEHMIRYTSLTNILRIEESIERYLRIHEEADNQESK